jgi:hypothetical protein
MEEAEKKKKKTLVMDSGTRSCVFMSVVKRQPLGFYCGLGRLHILAPSYPGFISTLAFWIILILPCDMAYTGQLALMHLSGPVPMVVVIL